MPCLTISVRILSLTVYSNSTSLVMETCAKKKTPQLYTTLQEEPSIQENSKPPENPQDSTPLVEDPQDGMDKDKSSDQLNDFVSAIKALGKNAARSGKVRELEPYTGWDLKKLKTFILQCHLYFQGSSDSFQDEAQQVTFAISYLPDVALEWFEPNLLGLTEEPPSWLEDWHAFVKELKTNFRPYDESGDIESKLVKLWMKDSQCISEYLVWFNSLAVHCSWGESTLRHRFYESLPSHLKDDVSCGEGKFKDLLGMCWKAQNSDARYWEHVQECS